jgi:hypothetical protein
MGGAAEAVLKVESSRDQSGVAPEPARPPASPVLGFQIWPGIFHPPKDLEHMRGIESLRSRPPSW